MYSYISINNKFCKQKSGRVRVRKWLRAQGTEHRGRRMAHTDDTDSKINTDLKAPLGGFGGKKARGVRSGGVRSEA
jgi:hypothetical protein